MPVRAPHGTSVNTGVPYKETLTRYGLIEINEVRVAPLSFFRHINRWLDAGLTSDNLRYLFRARSRRKPGQVIPFDVVQYFKTPKPMAVDFPAAVQIWGDLRSSELDLELPVLRTALELGFVTLEETIACVEPIWKTGAQTQQFLFELSEVKTRLEQCRSQT